MEKSSPLECEKPRQFPHERAPTKRAQSDEAPSDSPRAVTSARHVCHYPLCENPRAVKKNGQLHRLCEAHRAHANWNHKRWSAQIIRRRTSTPAQFTSTHDSDESVACGTLDNGALEDIVPWDQDELDSWLSDLQEATLPDILASMSSENHGDALESIQTTESSESKPGSPFRNEIGEGSAVMATIDLDYWLRGDRRAMAESFAKKSPSQHLDNAVQSVPIQSTGNSNFDRSASLSPLWPASEGKDEENWALTQEELDYWLDESPEATAPSVSASTSRQDAVDNSFGGHNE